MVRPCFLVIDVDYPGSISTRKLVIETAKFNVVTAYSGHEAVETLRTFPNLHGIVMDAKIRDMECSDLVNKLKQITPKVPIVVTSGRNFFECGPVDYHLDTYDPKQLLDLLKSLCPAETAAIQAHDESAS